MLSLLFIYICQILFRVSVLRLDKGRCTGRGSSRLFGLKVKPMRYLLSFIFFFLTVSLSLAQQQKELHRSKTVFQNESFKRGRILQSFNRHVDDSVNIFLKDASLCFVRHDTIYKAYLNNVLGVRLDSVEYKKVHGQMGRVVAHQGYNYLLCVTTVDMNRLKEETYSSNSAGFFDLDIPSASGVNVNTFFELDREKRDSDVGYPLKDTYYFWLSGKEILANETQVKKFVRPEMKEAFRTLMSDRFWSWNDEKSLTQLLMFFSSGQSLK